MRKSFKPRIVSPPSSGLPDDPLDDLWRVPTFPKPLEQPAQGHFDTAADALRFITAGNAIVTLQSKKTGTHYTYKIRRAENSNDDMAFVSALIGPDNENDYKYLGYIRRGVFFHGRRSPKPGDISNKAPCAVAWYWAYERLVRNAPLGDLIVMHEGQCGRCGRLLTHPNSIALGIGPECAQQMGL